MSRFTICCDVDAPDEVAATDSWMKEWAGRVRYLSKNKGCGCCVNIYDVEGPEEARADLPPALLADSEWTRRKT